MSRVESDQVIFSCLSYLKEQAKDRHLPDYQDSFVSPSTLGQLDALLYKSEASCAVGPQIVSDGDRRTPILTFPSAAQMLE